MSENCLWADLLKMEVKATKKHWIIVSAIGVALTLLVLLAREVFWTEMEVAAVLSHITDAFFITGVLICGMGLLIFSSNMGTFDMLSFGIKQGIRIFNPASKLEKNRQTYADYKEERANKKAPWVFMVIIGGGFLLISVLFLIIYSSI